MFITQIRDGHNNFQMCTANVRPRAATIDSHMWGIEPISLVQHYFTLQIMQYTDILRSVRTVTSTCYVFIYNFAWIWFIFLWYTFKNNKLLSFNLRLWPHISIFRCEWFKTSSNSWLRVIMFFGESLNM